ncbi:membrane protein [Pseudonocardia sp. EC080610-09]|uniref:hemolysin family protein n=1 Tax=unclassified Pseudonocardia TaxID=2619320 RepID=UPI0006CB22AA|nr:MULTISPECIES: hemolysin family protein [unclassified Pseudonocardia]ALE72804.1 membrane protein [Pseudonocardia sp. EC080625-04]ALL76125.1 membrane protein [Pseudonocardia sp. EC080610-09]ALL83149.1 membrane protein [Pseudonocardia sp. EC080619-01]
MSTVEIVVSVALIAASAFFVAVEFALVAARNYRLEEAAQTSASARAALRSAKDISLLLAGSQLGITLCVLGLGAVTKPAVDYALRPILEGWGLPGGVAGVVSFVISLIVVTFLHLVVGEMAPKSWAISHPERSAIMLAIPMRAFMVVARPLLLLLNGAANRCLRAVGVEPVDEMASGRNADDLRELVDHSAKTGALDQEHRDQLVTALELERTPLRDLAHEPSGVSADDDVSTVQDTARRTGHLRLIVRDGETPVGYVHVRDTLTRDPGTRARDLMRPVLTLPGDTLYHTAVNTMRDQRAHLALVESDGRQVGIVTLSDLVERLLPEPV